MPVLSVNASGTQIQVGFPAGGLPNTGRLDVTVRNVQRNLQDIRLGGFEYVNDPPSRKVRAIARCGAAGEGPGGAGGDALVVLATLLALAAAVLGRRRRGTDS
jgi:MYXO-CTERM domain-containing protein